MGGLTPEGGRAPRRGRTCSENGGQWQPWQRQGLQGFQRKGPRACRPWAGPRQPRPPVLPTDRQPGRDKGCPQPPDRSTAREGQ